MKAELSTAHAPLKKNVDCRETPLAQARRERFDAAMREMEETIRNSNELIVRHKKSLLR
jgi:hypothetical protein